MRAVLNALLPVVNDALQIYWWCIVIMAIMSWLMAFNVLNRSNHNVNRLYDFFMRITEPALRPIRRIVPYIGGIDISPVILLLAVSFLQRLISGILIDINTPPY